MVRSRRFPASLGSLSEIREFVIGEASGAGLTDARKMALELVLEELVVNVISYAYTCPLPPEPGEDQAGLLIPNVEAPEDFDGEGCVVIHCASGPDALARNGLMADVVSKAGEKPGNLFCVVLEDAGVPFDPLSVDEPQLDADVDSRRCGGLGIHFARERSEAIAYERNGGHNRLAFCVRIR
ncbi:ATP-binding protein [Oceanidesulfovibrio marinus]|uniref:Uncharacterized protein n=1 Tax=Oceanidesulfovibrio marinus TaxID=370038 RepID=A0A6P1ZKY8_9BACT|nr:ATP-binding protein [Oceanidesulfovibrio marinus]TVM36611.1 hypothetical protein DQK91_01430 [Oceanidesulfovibrio marinus]